MYTIGQLAKRYALSRSTLIYYDNQGLLKPSGRSSANYRLYSAADVEKLERILLFRNAGVALADIDAVMGQSEDKVAAALACRLDAINNEIQHLRRQQQVIVDILDGQGDAKSRLVNKDQWVAMLRAAGLDDEGMHQWHIEFEKSSPEAHQDFLQSIGIDAEEIAEIRAWSRA